MKQLLGWTTRAGIVAGSGILAISQPMPAQSSLFLAYPPDNHQTTSDRIFLIGTASPAGEVLVNNQPLQRSQAGHFAPSFPLLMGENIFTLRYENEEIKVKVTRLASEAKIPQGVAFAPDSLTPSQDIALLPGELVCFGAIAPPEATVSLSLGGLGGERALPLQPQSSLGQLPPNSAVLTADNRPQGTSAVGHYQGCTSFSEAGNLGNPRFQLTLRDKTITQAGPAKVTILSPNQLQVVEVTAKVGVARTGPSTDYSRLTPLPQGTQAAVTGSEGEWLRLDYGAWIRQEETQTLASNVPPRSLIRSISSRQVEGATEIIFPLQLPVPISVQQGDKTFTLTLYNTTAQTDTIYLDSDPVIERLDWQTVNPRQIQYTFHLKSLQQWGYDLRYDRTSLILSLRHPPQGARSRRLPLEGISILLDPGHGGAELGSRGPTGYPEKEVNLTVAKLLQAQLQQRGATVYLTREEDVDVSLAERVAMIDTLKPTIALSLHYNALPDNGDALNTAGVGAFWYHPQAQPLSQFLHDYLVAKLNRPSYGLFWNNLALTRPHTAPAVLLELGFMINPGEFEWVVDGEAQKQLAVAIATGLTEWFSIRREKPRAIN